MLVHVEEISISAKGSGPKTREFKLLMHFILFEKSYRHYEMYIIITKAMDNKYAVYKWM